MTSPLAHWYINLNATNEEAYAILSQDPVWNCFALADLEPPLRTYSQFAVAAQHKNDERAVCLVLRHPIIGQVISPFGNKEGVAAILRQLTLPEHPLIQAQEVHIPALRHYYQPETTWQGLLRMALTSSLWQSPQPVTPRPVRRLTDADLPALRDLYTQYPGNHFSADLFTQGMYFGAYEGERIIAAGGTHALTPAHHLAVLGNILTAPEARRQGYATAITAALVTALCAQHFSLVVLNVFEGNSDAIRVYQRLGFQTRHRFLTGKAILSHYSNDSRVLPHLGQLD